MLVLQKGEKKNPRTRVIGVSLKEIDKEKGFHVFEALKFGHKGI